MEIDLEEPTRAMIGAVLGVSSRWIAQPIATDMTSAGLRTAGRAQSWRARQTVR